MSKVHEFFEKTLPSHKEKYIHRLSDTSAHVHFEIPGAGDWVLLLKDGELTIQEGAPSGKPDCRIWLKQETFEKVLTGEAKILSCILFGKIKVSGNVALAKNIASALQGGNA